MSLLNDSDVSHKEKTSQNYTAEFKLKVILHAEAFFICIGRRIIAHWVYKRTDIHLKQMQLRERRRKDSWDVGKNP